MTSAGSCEPRRSKLLYKNVNGMQKCISKMKDLLSVLRNLAADGMEERPVIRRSLHPGAAGHESVVVPHIAAFVSVDPLELGAQVYTLLIVLQHTLHLQHW